MNNRPSDGAPLIVATIGGRAVPRSEVIAWEGRRAAKVARRLGLSPETGSVEDQRATLAEFKAKLGHTQVEQMFSRQIQLSSFGLRVLGRLSRQRRAFSRVELFVSATLAAAFVAWWDLHVVGNDEMSTLAACPDHWIIQPGPNGWQEVVERTGGSPFASRLYIDYSKTDELRSKPDPGYTHQIVAVARCRDGNAIGGIRHQLRDTATGCQMILTAEFPGAVLPYLVRAHRWHLACEFSNMIEATLRSGYPPESVS